jgi:O-antigen/teichoic acid export membrane protein
LLGLYTVAAHIASLPNQRISGIINQVAFPAFARMQEDVPRVRANVLKGVRLLSFVTVPFLWGLASVAPEFVSAVLGERWQLAAPVLLILALVMPLRIVSNFVMNAVQGVGRSDVVLATVAFATIVTPAFFLIGVQWGLQGLSMGWVASVPLVFIFGMSRGLRTLGLCMKDLLRAMLAPVVASAIMICVVLVARFLLPEWISGLWLLGSLVLTGVVTYIAGSLGINRSGADEARTLIEGLFARSAAVKVRE